MTRESESGFWKSAPMSHRYCLPAEHKCINSTFLWLVQLKNLFRGRGKRSEFLLFFPVFNELVHFKELLASVPSSDVIFFMMVIHFQPPPPPLVPLTNQNLKQTAHYCDFRRN